MAYTEDDIKYEKDIFAVIREGASHKVLVNGLTHAVSIVEFRGDADGLSLGVAYVDYLTAHASDRSIARMAGIEESTIAALRRRAREISSCPEVLAVTSAC